MKIWLEKYIEDINATLDRYFWLYHMLNNDKKTQEEIEKTIFILNNHKLLLQASRNGDCIKMVIIKEI